MSKLLVLLLAANTYGSTLQLENLLPDQPGFTWTYWGFAEYGHRMRLQSIEATECGKVYLISGMVEDVSDGEAPGDYSVTLRYVVSDSVLSVVQHAPRTMDNDFDEMELLRLPLVTGNRWIQTVVDGSGEEVELVCEIEEMSEGKLTVRYSRTDSPFYQLREFEQGLGVTRFAKLFIFPEGSFEMDYLLYRGKY